MKRSLIVGLLLGSSALVNLGQAYRIWQLEDHIAVMKGENQLKEGSPVPPLAILNSAGTRTVIPVGDRRPLIVYWMSPGCGWCQRNEANVHALIQQIGERYRVAVLTMSARGATTYDSIRRLGVPVLGEPDASTSRVYRFGGTPQTIVIGSDGKVLRVWSGAYMGRLKQDVEKYLYVSLPGLSDLSTGSPAHD